MLSKKLLRFLIIFFGVFVLCYYGTQAVIGLSSPEDRYSPFVANYLDYVSVLRKLLMTGTRGMLAIFGINTFQPNDTMLRGVNGGGFNMVYGCLGIGVMSFWTAYSVATGDGWKRIISRLLIGLAIIFLINVTRLSLVLAASQKGWAFPFGLDHHDWFNILTYALIFLMIFLNEKRRSTINNGLRPPQADKQVIESA